MVQAFQRFEPDAAIGRASDQRVPGRIGVDDHPALVKERECHGRIIEQRVLVGHRPAKLPDFPQMRAAPPDAPGEARRY